jgi:hypothetical protein
MKDLTPFRDLLLSVDPKVTKFEGNGETNYTVWTPYTTDKTMSDNTEDDSAWNIQVDRFTKTDNDPVAAAIYDKLTQAHIPFEYELDYEKETKYIHHIFTCIF